MSDLAGNHEDGFSRDPAQIIQHLHVPIGIKQHNTSYSLTKFLASKLVTTVEALHVSLKKGAERSKAIFFISWFTDPPTQIFAFLKKKKKLFLTFFIFSDVKNCQIKKKISC